MYKGSDILRAFLDGQFQKAGYDAGRIAEAHGSIHHLQCIHGCMADIWPADGFVPVVDAERYLLENHPPDCPHCGAVARPNILMFGDFGWLEQRTHRQLQRLQAWMKTVGRVVLIEIGAGLHVPTVRHFSEGTKGALIRINPTDAGIPDGKPGVGLPCGGLEGNRAIQAAMATA